MTMPASITLSRLGWSAPDGAAVLSDLDFTFTRERIGIVGRNGVGKSTLLSLIDGSRQPSAGRIHIEGTIATLRQTVQVEPDHRIADLFDARAALALLDRAEAGNATMAMLADCDWTLPARIEAALATTGLDASPQTPLARLSGGQRTRAALAAAIFARPDFLLLDEPTNHLDTEGRRALADMLAQWRAGAIVVSHDRALLETMEAIGELTTLGLARYGGNWSDYRARKEIEQDAAAQELDHATRRLDQVARKIQLTAERKQRRDGVGARIGAKGGMPRILIGARKNQAETSGGQAARLADRLRAEATEAEQLARARVEHHDDITVALPPARVANGQRIVTLGRITAGYDPAHPVLHDVSFSVVGPERVAIGGANGSGKSTLLHVIAGSLSPLSGTIALHVPAALLDQNVDFIDRQASIADNFARLHPDIGHQGVRAALARFGFRADLALQRAGTLSGGELLRAGLACVLSGQVAPPLLLLDEPTNHLDLDSIAAVEAGLRAYDGALIVVSHDRAFLDAIGIDRHIAVD
ncbi:ABC-F family ATP-binding cassette domain-containing protein [Sphingobium sp. AN558]|uniref:ABC-F family ATP-binding cassette domain-containing protein n=1 Tax=Sphingobium sp. AN558 TaxID=3133442 RepID=UPI0030BC4FBE